MSLKKSFKILLVILTSISGLAIKISTISTFSFSVAIERAVLLK